jgi:hypothetical protein
MRGLAAVDLVGPVDGLEIDGGGGAFGEAVARLDFLVFIPVAGLVAADEIERGGEDVLAAEESGFHLVIEGQGAEDLGHGELEDDVDEGEHAEEVELGGRLAEERGEELAELGALEGELHDGLGGGGGEGVGDGDGDDFAELVVADEEERAADGGNGGGQGVEGGVDEAQETVADAGVGHDELLDLVDVGGDAAEGGEDAEIDEAVLGDDAGGDDEGLAEEVSLKEIAAFGACILHIFDGLDLFGDEACADAGGHGVDALALGGIGGAEVDFDEGGELEEGTLGVVGCEVIEGEAVATLAERVAGDEELGVGVDVFEDFENGGGGREQGDDAGDEGLTGAVDEGDALAGLGHEHEAVVDDLAGGFFAISGKSIHSTGAEEQLVAIEIEACIEDGLPAQESGGNGFGFRAVRRARVSFGLYSVRQPNPPTSALLALVCRSRVDPRCIRIGVSAK